MPDLTENSSHPAPGTAGEPVLRRPTVEDGAAMWRIARDSEELDLNTSYAYLLWARDFAATSVVATLDEEPVGFVSGYVRPDDPRTFMVWQVAVDASARGKRLGRTMLDFLVADGAVDALETTITADNAASIALFTSFGNAHGASVESSALFTAEMFPDGHDAELLFRIAPLSR